MIPLVSLYNVSLTFVNQFMYVRFEGAIHTVAEWGIQQNLLLIVVRLSGYFKPM